MFRPFDASRPPPRRTKSKMEMALCVLAMGAVGVCAMFLYRVFILPLRMEGHSFRKTNSVKTRMDRKLFASKSNEQSSEYFLNKDMLYIYHQQWTNTPQPKDVLTVIVLCHGFSEHSSRYVGMAKALLTVIPTCAVIALDHQGHGKSEGDRLYVRKFEDYCDDVIQLCEIAKQRFPQARQVILGHSMGGLIAIRTVQRYPQQFALAVISAPALEIKLSFIEANFGPLLAHYLPHMVTSSSVDLNDLCNNTAVTDLCANDPLCCSKQGSTARLGGELLSAMQEALAFAGEITLPYLLVRGTQDKVALRNGIVDFHASTSSTDKEFHEFDGMLHEVFNEESSAARMCVARWIQERIRVENC